MIKFIRKKASILVLLVFVLSVFPFGNASASDNESFDAGSMIVEHITDSYEWHIVSFGHKHISIPLPVILYDNGSWHIFSSAKLQHGQASYKGYELGTEGMLKGKIVRKEADGSIVRPIDMSITKNVLAVFIASGLMIFIFMYVSKMYRQRRKHAPKGFQSVVEYGILFIKDEIAIPSIGEKHYERYMPYLLTVFFFIFFNNLLGLIPIFPFGANVTGNIAVTGVLALFTFLLTTFMSNKNYWRNIFNTPGVPWWLKFPLPLMPIIEVVGMFTKPFVLMVRLFANITAGHIIILGFISLIFVFGETNIYAGYGMSVLSLGLVIFMNFLELLVAFIQAYVFTLLSAIFLGAGAEEYVAEEKQA